MQSSLYDTLTAEEQSAMSVYAASLYMLLPECLFAELVFSKFYFFESHFTKLIYRL
jgi:hypothetical protein